MAQHARHRVTRAPRHRRRAPIGRRLTSVTAATVLSAGFLAAAPTTSQAGQSTKATVRTSGGKLNIRASPRISAPVIRKRANGRKVSLRCYVHSDSVTGPTGVSTTLWYRLKKKGSVSDAFLYTGTSAPVTRKCKKGPGVSKPSGPGRAWGETRTVNLGAKGNCTWGAYQKFKAHSGVYPAINGNAKDVGESARARGWTVVLPAQAKSIVVFQPGVHGANRTYGHVAWVNSTEQRSDGLYINITEMNWRGLGVWSTRTVKDIRGMSFILAP